MSKEGCKACGICCEMYGTTINASPCDLDRWRSEGRDDILAHVGPEGELWVNASTEERVALCPFYFRDGPDSGGCEIHDTKPRTCRLYPTVHHNWRCVTGAIHAP
jgi:Fe-S-cluster containining protein